MPGYNFRESIDDEYVAKAGIGFDYAKVEVLSVPAAGMEYVPSLPSGNAVVDMPPNGVYAGSKKIAFNMSNGLATTMSKGFIVIGGEKMEFDGNTGVGFGLTSGELTITRRGVVGEVKPHSNGALISFDGPSEMNARQESIVMNEGTDILWINPEDWTVDTSKSWPVSPGGVFYTSQSAVNTWFMFSGGAGNIPVRILNFW